MVPSTRHHRGPLRTGHATPLTVIGGDGCFQGRRRFAATVRNVDCGQSGGEVDDCGRTRPVARACVVRLITTATIDCDAAPAGRIRCTGVVRARLSGEYQDVFVGDEVHRHVSLPRITDLLELEERRSGNEPVVADAGQ